MRFTLSFRDVEDLLAERGVDVSYETVRRRVIKFGPLLARELRCRRARPTRCWHLDEMVVTIAGKRHWLWRAVDSEGEVLDMLVQSRRDTAAQDATVQIARISATLLVLPRCRPQHFRPPATSDLAPDPPPVSGRSDEHVAGCDRCLKLPNLRNGDPLFNHHRLT